MTELLDENHQSFSVAYHGSDRAKDHSINVRLLAPALMGFDRLFAEFNRELNGKGIEYDLVVLSEFENRCFSMDLDLVISTTKALKSLFESDGIKTAKKILELVGVFGGDGGSSFYSLFDFLKVKGDRKIENAQPVISDGQTTSINVKVEGNSNQITIKPIILKMSENPKALKAIKDIVRPIGEDGFDRLEYRNHKTGDILHSKADIDSIVLACDTGIELAKEIEEEPEVEETSAWLSVYSPVFDPKADKWRFRMGREIIYVDISNTSIAADALQRGGSMTDDSYNVRIKVTTPKDAKGKLKEPIFEIISVVKFIPGQPQEQGRFI